MPRETWTILKLLQWATAYFESHSIEEPRAAAEILLAHTLNLARVDLYIQYDRPLEFAELKAFKDHVKRRLQREPVAYIVGEKGFWSLDLKVTRDVLIPRPETEILVEAALEIIPPKPLPGPFRVLDLGTGSGGVILALAKERNGHRFYATDSSPKALAVARDNALRLGLDRGINFFQGNWFQALQDLKSYFDLVVSNPPYISHSDFDMLPPEISQYEPRQALDGGSDGLDAIRLIIKEATDYIKPGGWLLFEIGDYQWDSVKKLVETSSAYAEASIIRDYSGLCRVVRVRTTMQ